MKLLLPLILCIINTRAKSIDHFSHINLLLNTFNYCIDSQSLVSCLKQRSLLILDRLTKEEDAIHLVGNSLVLVKDPDVRTGSRMLPLTAEELDAGLSKEANTKEDTLDHLLFSALTKFIKSRTLQIRMPDFALGMFRNNLEEGRKKNKGGGAGMGLMMAGGMMSAMGFSALAMLAGKALMVSMMALLLAALAALKKGSHGGSHGATTYEVINVPTGHGHHGRSMKEDADLAYRAHQEQSSSTSSPS